MKKVLIDSDVILDFYFDRQPFSTNAAKVLSLCESKQITGYITPVILSNVYYILKSIAKKENVRSNLKLLLEILDILTINKDTIINALNSKFNDLEDAIQYYAAESSMNIDIILTRNTKDYKESTISVMQPEQFLTYFVNLKSF